MDNHLYRFRSSSDHKISINWVIEIKKWIKEWIHFPECVFEKFMSDENILMLLSICLHYLEINELVIWRVEFDWHFFKNLFHFIFSKRLFISFNSLSSNVPASNYSTGKLHNDRLKILLFFYLFPPTQITYESSLFKKLLLSSNSFNS